MWGAIFSPSGSHAAASGMKRAWLHGGIVPRSVPFCVRRHSINTYVYMYIGTLYDVISGPASLCRVQCIRVPPLYTVELFIFIFFPNSLIDSRHCVRSLFALSGTYYYYVCMCTLIYICDTVHV